MPFLKNSPASNIHTWRAFRLMSDGDLKEMQGGDMTAEGAGACYRLDVSNVSISIYGAILTPTPWTDKVYGSVLLLQCTMCFNKFDLFINKQAYTILGSCD
jgi:hypothetical protein